MKERITIARKNHNGTMTAIAERILRVELEENTMILKAKFNGKWYPVEGNMYLQYIVVYK